MFWEKNKNTSVKFFTLPQLPELYEKMLLASCFEPEKFKDLKFIIESITKDNIVPDGFKELHDTFMKVIDNELE